MMFEEFIEKLRFELKSELPGFSAQNQMAPIGRKRAMEEFKKSLVVPKKSAVLMLLYPNAVTSVPQIIFIIRSASEKGNHGGQIAFPGGGVDERDITMSDTALRETEEEIGVDRKVIDIVGGLSPLYIPVSNYFVHPFIGACDHVPVFKTNTLEVSGLLEVEVSELLSEKNKTISDIYIKSINGRMNVPCYSIKGKIIWGATAMMIAEFSEVIRRVK